MMDGMMHNMGGTMILWSIVAALLLFALALGVIKLVRKSAGMEKRRRS